MSNSVDDELMNRAQSLASSEPMMLALADVARNVESWELASRDIERFLAERGIELPDGVAVRTLPWPGYAKPTPDWLPFTLRLTQCRTVWIKDKEGPGYRQETICLGFEIIPNQLPPIA